MFSLLIKKCACYDHVKLTEKLYFGMINDKVLNIVFIEYIRQLILALSKF